MTDQPLSFSEDLARYSAGALRQALENGNLTADDVETAKDAMRAGAVLAHRRQDGTFTIRIGSVVDIDGHIFDLPSLAADWAATAT
ncbi:hypothetical protein ACH4LS_22660 [Streptomyces luteogriseus]|uniref:hypothetical protein n=1 Tax=Streptomyces luteogriseus TaxID=68233 RepID=UPI0037AF2C7C